MDYASHRVERYVRSQFDFDGSDTMSVIGPKGKRGLLYNYGIYDVTETFAGTTKPLMSVGDGVTADKYGAALSLTSASGDGGMHVNQQGAPTSTTWKNLMKLRELPADAKVVLTLTAGVTGPAGIATAFMDIIWEL